MTLERLRLAVATAVDVAWARRASGNSDHALAAMHEIKDIVDDARDKDLADRVGLDELLNNIAEAESAVAKSASERESVRRTMRERLHITLMGHSTIQPLPSKDD